MKKQTINSPKCFKTVTGKHRWEEGCFVEEMSLGHKFATCRECAFCGLIDDTHNELKDFIERKIRS
jgi:hypothetical protein